MAFELFFCNAAWLQGRNVGCVTVGLLSVKGQCALGADRLEWAMAESRFNEMSGGFSDLHFWVDTRAYGADGCGRIRPTLPCLSLFA